MSTTLTRLPGAKWWIETDDTTGEIVGTYNKTRITADIQAIRETLLQYPDAGQDAQDVVSLTNAITAAGWTIAKQTRIGMLVQTMYQAYQADPRQMEAAQLQAKLDSLIALKERLV